MEQENPFGATPENNASDKSKESKKKRKRSRSFRVPLGTEASKEASAKKVEKSRDLAGLVIGANKETDKEASKAEKSEKQAGEKIQPHTDLKMPDTPELRALQQQVASALEASGATGATEKHKRSTAEAGGDTDEQPTTIEGSDLIKGGEKLDKNEVYGGETILSGVIYSREEEMGKAETSGEPEDPQLLSTVENVEPILYNAQPQLQHMSHYEDISEPDDEEVISPQQLTRAQGHGTPSATPNILSSQSTPVPPKQPGNTPPPQGPNPPYGPRSAWNPNFQSLHPAQANVLPNPGTTPGNTITQQDVEDAEYYGRKRGVGQGVAAGLMLGGTYEHFKHKRREKKAEKRFKQQQKQLEQARTDYNFSLQEQSRQNADTQRRLQDAGQQNRSPERRFSAQPTKPEMVHTPTVPVAVHAEIKPAAPKPEQVQSAHAEQLAIPKDHRIETSAWHSIEVDAKTGKAVEQPNFAYGQEYYHERAQEVQPRDKDAPATKQAAATAIGATIGTSLSAGQNDQSPSARSQTQNTNSRAQKINIDQLKSKAKTGLNAAMQQVTTPGSIWPMVGILIALVIAIAVLI